MAKLNRERRLLEKRAAKQAKKEARKRAAAEEGDSVAQPTLNRWSTHRTTFLPDRPTGRPLVA